MVSRRQTGRIFVISSPSGGGKTTVVERLLRAAPRLARSVSVTTRPPRPGERHGRDYRFVTPAAFRRLQRSGRLLERANVHGEWYGTLKAPVLRALARERHVVLCIDVQGARQVRRVLGARAVLIFLLPPSIRRLRARLLRRRTESPAAIRRRLAAARREIACARGYDHAVVNDRLDRTVRTMHVMICGNARAQGAGEQRKGQPTHGASAD
jgi:guanylate kinase